MNRSRSKFRLGLLLDVRSDDALLRILISNDDGSSLQGIQALAAEAVSRGTRVTVGTALTRNVPATGHG